MYLTFRLDILIGAGCLVGILIFVILLVRRRANHTDLTSILDHAMALSLPTWWKPNLLLWSVDSSTVRRNRNKRNISMISLGGAIGMCVEYHPKSSKGELIRITVPGQRRLVIWYELSRVTTDGPVEWYPDRMMLQSTAHDADNEQVKTQSLNFYQQQLAWHILVNMQERYRSFLAKC